MSCGNCGSRSLAQVKFIPDSRKLHAATHAGPTVVIEKGASPSPFVAQIGKELHDAATRAQSLTVAGDLEAAIDAALAKTKPERMEFNRAHLLHELLPLFTALTTQLAEEKRSEEDCRQIITTYADECEGQLLLLADVTSQLAEAKAERDDLAYWKKSAMMVSPPMQEIGQLIGVQLGDSIHDKILPALTARDSVIEQLVATMRRLLTASQNWQAVDLRESQLAAHELITKTTALTTKKEP